MVLDEDVLKVVPAKEQMKAETKNGMNNKTGCRNHPVDVIL